MAWQEQGDRAVPEVGETGGIAREGGVEVLADLTAQSRSFIRRPDKGGGRIRGPDKETSYFRAPKES
jgi:hypothetical protein